MMTPAGVYMARPNCCAQWQTPAFDSLPDPLVIGGTTYYKDHQRFFEYTTNPPPQHEFPGISALALSNWTLPYDNTTCKDRCCRRAIVNTPTAECEFDWRQCAKLIQKGDPNPQPCSSEINEQCATWVPCDVNDRGSLFVELISPLLMSAVYMAFLVYVLIVNRRPKTDFFQPDFKAYRPFFGGLFLVFIIMSLFALAAVSDYEQWLSQTEVNLEFVSYQSCVAYCNRGQGASTTQSRFCADPPNPQYALFPEDFNRKFNVPCPPDNPLDPYVAATYCRSCHDHISDWQSLDQAVRHLKIKTYLLWALMLLFAAIDLAEHYTTHEGQQLSLYLQWALRWECILLGLAFAACFVSDIYFASRTRGLFSIRDYIGSYPSRGQTVPISVSDVCCSFIAYDGVFVLMLSTLLFPISDYLSKYSMVSWADAVAEFKAWAWQQMGWMYDRIRPVKQRKYTTEINGNPVRSVQIDPKTVQEGATKPKESDNIHPENTPNIQQGNNNDTNNKPQDPVTLVRINPETIQEATKPEVSNNMVNTQDLKLIPDNQEPQPRVKLPPRLTPLSNPPRPPGSLPPGPLKPLPPRLPKPLPGQVVSFLILPPPQSIPMTRNSQPNMNTTKLFKQL